MHARDPQLDNTLGHDSNATDAARPRPHTGARRRTSRAAIFASLAATTALAAGLSVSGCMLGAESDPEALDDENIAADSNAVTGSLPVGTTLVSTTNAKLRSGPGTSYSILATVPYGSSVVVVRSTPTNGFYRVKYNGITGWSSGQLYVLGGGSSSSSSSSSGSTSSSPSSGSTSSSSSSSSGSAGGTTYLHATFESSACGASIADQNVDGVFWDTTPELPTNVRCSLSTPNGSRYAEWNYPAGANLTGPELYGNGNTGLDVSVAPGTTYYLAAFVRFQRNGADIWADTGSSPYQFDKLIEFRGAGFRWGIGAGWNGWYTNGTDHKFTFDAWYATSVLGERGPDHLVANVAPYNANNPLLSDYEKWHGLVLGVTAAASDSGRVQLWVDGVKVIDKSQYTAAPGAVIDHAILIGTVAQPAYNAPSHLRQMDDIMITKDWQSILNGGYLNAN